MDREITTPFHLKLFYRLHSFHQLSDFPIPSPPTNGSSVPVPPVLPPHLQIYTWYSCSLRELAQLLTSCLPSLLPDPAVGTRLAFRLIYPDTKPSGPAGAAGHAGPGGSSGLEGDGRGKYLSKGLGSVVIGVDDNSKGTTAAAANGDGGSAKAQRFQFQSEDADKTLQDFRFVIGDYIDCAILPPLSDGSVAPPISIKPQPGGNVPMGGMRAFGGGPYARGRGPGSGLMGRVSMPSGGWSRGERLPDSGGRGGGPRGNGRNRGRPY